MRMGSRPCQTRRGPSHLEVPENLVLAGQLHPVLPPCTAGTLPPFRKKQVTRPIHLQNSLGPREVGGDPRLANLEPLV